MNDINKTLEQRGSKYGDFTDNARVAQQLKRVIAPYREKFSDIHNEGLDMIFSKICRMCNGDPNYADNWHDIIGYASLVEERLPREEERLPKQPEIKNETITDHTIDALNYYSPSVRR